jgi:hypothetical protein
MTEKEYMVNKIPDCGGKIQKNPYRLVLEFYQ